MKTLAFAIAVILTVIGLFVLVVRRDPAPTQTREAIDVLNQAVPGVPKDAADPGFLNLKKRLPNEGEPSETFNRDYTADQAMQRMAQVEEFLRSFIKLTEVARSRISQEALSAVGNTGAEMQTIGFHNIPLVVEGTILKQDYQIKQLEYKLAQLQRIGGDINADTFEQKRSAYEVATRKFQMFWDTRIPTD